MEVPAHEIRRKRTHRVHRGAGNGRRPETRECNVPAHGDGAVGADVPCAGRRAQDRVHEPGRQHHFHRERGAGGPATPGSVAPSAPTVPNSARRKTAAPMPPTTCATM